MLTKFNDLVEQMVQVYKENTNEEGYTDAKGVNDLLEIVISAVPDDRAELMARFEKRVRDETKNSAL